MLSKYDEIRARRARGEAGFSLIELLVVVVIMGILIAIAMPVYLNYQNNAKKKSVEADVRNTIPAVEQCIADNNATFDATKCGTVKVETPGNTVSIAADSDHAGAYTITGNRAGDTPDVPWQVVYTSFNGKVTTPASTSGSDG